MKMNKKVWITGASSGIGKSLALKFAKEGWQVAVSARRENLLKDLKTSTRQRFIAIDFDYPEESTEASIIAHESGVDELSAGALASLGARIHNLRQHGCDEGVSTRLLIYAGQLISQGVAADRACDVAISRAVSDDIEVQTAMNEVVTSIFPDSGR